MHRRLLLVGIAVLVVAATTILFWRFALRRAERAMVTPREETIDLATLVTQVRGLNRLETATMRVVHVGTIRQSYTLVPDALGGDEITLFAAGDVIAGVDLSQFREEDSARQPDGTVVLRLPRAQILVTRVDNRATRVVNRKTGLLRRADTDLETRARQHAESMIRAEALKRGIVKLADDNAERSLAELLHAVGFQKVRFVRVEEALPRGGQG